MPIILAIVAVFALFFLGTILKLSAKTLKFLVINGIGGVLLLLVFNFFGSIFQTSLDINFVNALVAGFLGIPGIILLLLLQ